MIFVKNVKYFEGECGEHISNFAKELVNYRKESKCDLIGRFNDICIEIKNNTTEEDILKFYRQHM